MGKYIFRKIIVQEMPHPRPHIFPRFKNDGFGLKISEQNSTDEPARSVLKMIAAEVRKLI